MRGGTVPNLTESLWPRRGRCGTAWFVIRQSEATLNIVRTLKAYHSLWLGSDQIFERYPQQLGKPA